MYAPLAALFGADSTGADGGNGMLRFGLRTADGGQPRATIECVATGATYFIALVWQEDWTANPLARARQLKGYLVYQQTARDSRFFARPFSIVEDKVDVPAGDEHAFEVHAPLPPDALKLGMWTPPPSQAPAGPS